MISFSLVPFFGCMRNADMFKAFISTKPPPNLLEIRHWSSISYLEYILCMTVAYQSLIFTKKIFFSYCLISNVCTTMPLWLYTLLVYCILLLQTTLIDDVVHTVVTLTTMKFIYHTINFWFTQTSIGKSFFWKQNDLRRIFKYLYLDKFIKVTHIFCYWNLQNQLCRSKPAPYVRKDKPQKMYHTQENQCYKPRRCFVHFIWMV